MTSKLKCPVCPFCSGKLYCSDNSYSCLNDQCLFGDFFFVAKRWNAIIELKQALIQAKQDLAKAIDVIDTVRQHKRGTAVICPNDIAAYCDRAIERITHDNSEKPKSQDHIADVSKMVEHKE